MRYIHERPDWPHFTWDAEALAVPLTSVRHEQGRLLGRMESLGFALRKEASFDTLTQDVLKTSAIEGEILDTAEVRSSLARRLGIEMAALKPASRAVNGVVDMLLDATLQYQKPLTQERLHGWHAALFPTGYSGLHPISVGAWRGDERGPMQVVSGAIGHEKVHFEAPAAARLSQEMAAFLAWFEQLHPALDGVLKAAISHLWFVTLHPLDDGNGRIARAIADLALARSERSPQRFYSMSAQIQQERADYYAILERSQKGDLNITSWLEWFLGCLHRAILGAQETLAAVLHKARFWESVKDVSLNPRQRLMLNKLLDGFDGKLTSSKWAKLAKCSQDTALRDIQELLAQGVLCKEEGGGRSSSYTLAVAGECQDDKETPCL